MSAQGAHLKDELPKPPPIGQPEGAIPVLAPPNSCLIFDRRLWHAASNNFSTEHERLASFVGCETAILSRFAALAASLTWQAPPSADGYRWIRPRDGMYVEPALAQLSCPIARQLLGATTSNQGLYSGNRDDVPVRLSAESLT